MKWFIRIVCGLLFLSLLFAAVLLLPAHVQVRSVEPTLPSGDELFSSLNSLTGFGDPSGPSKVSYLLTSHQPVKRGQISHISILIEWANGKSFLLDTGMSPAGAEEFGNLLRKLDTSAGEVNIIGDVADLLGSDIKRVAGVGFTHLHIDHVQGLSDFCVARGGGAVLFQTSSQRELHNFNTSEGAGLVENSCLERASIASLGNRNIYATDQFPGLAAIELGGHTPGSTLWAVVLNDKLLLFSGDITNDKMSIDHDIPKQAVYSYLLVPENVERTQSIRRWLKELDSRDQFSVIVSHDLASTKAHLPLYRAHPDQNE